MMETNSTKKVLTLLPEDVSNAIWESPRLNQQRRELNFTSFGDFILNVYDVEYAGLDNYRATEHNLNWLLMHV